MNHLKRYLAVLGASLAFAYAALFWEFGATPTSAPHPAPEQTLVMPQPSAALAPQRAVSRPPGSSAPALRTHTPALLPDPELALPSKPAEPAAASEQPSAAHGETSFAQWMLEAIRGKEWDRKRTETIEALLATALERAPTLHAQELECGSRFCRAVFVDQSGSAPELRPLIGAPPFDGDGYTLPNPDGTAEIYFTRVGESLQALREEAMK